MNQDLLNFCDESTPIVLLGDLNARTRTFPGNFEIDNNVDKTNIEPTEFLLRRNCDEHINGQGQRLVDLYIHRKKSENSLR